MMTLRALAGFVMLACSAQVQAQSLSPRIAGFEAGIICATDVISVEPAPDTVAGFTNVIEGEVPFVSHSRVVPAAIGIGFGVKSQTKSEDLPFVTIVVTHPPMGPEGTTRQSYTSALGPTSSGLTSYQLEYDYELVQGEWTFTALDGDQELWTTAFEVVDPRTVPELAAVCGYENLLS